MKIARVAVLGVAVGAGLIAALIAMNLSRPAPAPEPTTAVNTPTVNAQVLVASADIPVGTTLKADSVQWADWPSTGISAKFIKRVGAGDSQIEPVVGAIARASFYTGEPISEAKLIRSDQGFMSAILPAGMRAVATKIAADTSAGGFILPNDRVDVILSKREKNAGLANSPDIVNSEIILSNIRVLAIDQAPKEKDGQKVVVGKTATLELTPAQTETLALSQQLGTLSLALRSIADASHDTPQSEDKSGARRAGVNIVRFGIGTMMNSK